MLFRSVECAAPGKAHPSMSMRPRKNVSAPTNALPPLTHPVRTARANVGLTQETLAEAVGVSRQTIISIESGDYAPSVVLALRIAQRLDSTVEQLWGAAAAQ